MSSGNFIYCYWYIIWITHFFYCYTINLNQIVGKHLPMIRYTEDGIVKIEHHYLWSCSDLDLFIFSISVSAMQKFLKLYNLKTIRLVFFKNGDISIKEMKLINNMLIIFMWYQFWILFNMSCGLHYLLLINQIESWQIIKSYLWMHQTNGMVIVNSQCPLERKSSMNIKSPLT